MSQELESRAQELMEEKDSDSRLRTFSGGMKVFAELLLVLFALFHLWANLTGTLGAVKLRTAHIMLLLPLVFLFYPTWKTERRSRRFPRYGT